MTPTDHAAIVREALHEALTLLHGLDYEEESRIDRAVTAIENLAPALDALEAQAETGEPEKDERVKILAMLEAAEAERDRLEAAYVSAETQITELLAERDRLRDARDRFKEQVNQLEESESRLAARVEELEAALRGLLEQIGNPDKDCLFCIGHYGKHSNKCEWAAARAALDKDTA
jgi:chromosome segregation ATPase